MKAIIGGAMMALGLVGSAMAQENDQFTSFARVGGRFVALQTVAQDASAFPTAFSFMRVRTEETASGAPSSSNAARAPIKPRQVGAAATTSTQPPTKAAKSPPQR